MPEPPHVRSGLSHRGSIVRPVFGLGKNTEVPYDYPRRGPDCRVEPVRRAAQRCRRGACGRLRYQAHVLDNWFLGVQRSLWQDVIVEADYIGSRGRNAQSRKWDVNRFNGDLFDNRLDRILPGFAAINYTDSAI